MKKTIGMIAILFAGSIAHAGFNGTWNGTGRVSNNKGGNTACEKVVLKIDHTATKMDIDSKFTCGGKTIQGPAGKLIVKGGEVFNAAGAKIGTVTETTCDLSLDSADSFMTSTERIVGTTMTFKTVHGDKKTGVTTTYEGTAQR